MGAKKANSLANLTHFKRNAEAEIQAEETEHYDTATGRWNEGRRIVELQVLIDGLRQCAHCKEPLRLEGLKDEQKYGLASILYIECSMCKGLSSVPTGKRHSTTGDGPAKCFDVNSKVASGMS